MTDLPHHYICSSCAQSKGATWPKDHLATAHENICGYCKETKSLCCVTDWNWPKNVKVKGDREI